eukprot:CAMPEP_0175250140 /NCGR_PEP_ID=MMETSP0093-20121207/35003_1 /TAXON_ID=311494 /ORGANISM="Alexandrium monilatum, Strain CCMP3105" /LENGTH=351 /DNA_ID=CAMNT_0016544383 /DNA_START=59 /DNA_END=1114 /DNA_ORIENTATION=+
MAAVPTLRPQAAAVVVGGMASRSVGSAWRVGATWRWAGSHHGASGTPRPLPLPSQGSAAAASAVAVLGATAHARATGSRAARAGSAPDEAKALAALEFLEARRPSSSRPSAPSTPPGRQAVEVGAGASAGPAQHATAPPGDDATTAAFTRIYCDEEWGAEARSGLGSREGTTREFRVFLEGFLRDYGITSVVDAGCGHWPTGYQRFMDWQGVHYTGVDVVPYVVRENTAYFSDPATLQARGLASAQCQVGSVCDTLPGADVLLVKDVLMHLPNAAVGSFLQSSISVAPARYRYVLLVQNSVPPVNVREMIDIEPGQLLPFNIAAPPFNAAFVDVFKWQSDEPKVVQLWEAP